MNDVLMATQTQNDNQLAALRATEELRNQLDEQISVKQNFLRRCQGVSPQLRQAQKELNELNRHREMVVEKCADLQRSIQKTSSLLMSYEDEIYHKRLLNAKADDGQPLIAAMLRSGINLAAIAAKVGRVVDESEMQLKRQIDIGKRIADPDDKFAEAITNVFQSEFERGWNDGLMECSYQKLARVLAIDRYENVEAGINAGELDSPAEGVAGAALTFLTASNAADTPTWRVSGVTLTHEDITRTAGQALMARFYSAGMLARRTLDRMVTTAIAGATWTNATGALALTTANISAAIANYKTLTLADSKPYPAPTMLIVAADQVAQARTVLWSDGSEGDGGLRPVVAGELATGTTWYLACNPAILSAFSLVVPRTQQTPSLVPVSAGYAAIARWRLELPAKVVVGYAAAGKPAGWRQFT